jgi:hypothetical protein
MTVTIEQPPLMSSTPQVLFLDFLLANIRLLSSNIEKGEYFIIEVYLADPRNPETAVFSYSLSTKPIITQLSSRSRAGLKAKA